MVMRQFDAVKFNAAYGENGRITGWGRILYIKKDNRVVVKVIHGVHVSPAKTRINFNKPISFSVGHLTKIDVRSKEARLEAKKEQKARAAKRAAKLSKVGTAVAPADLFDLADGKDEYFPGSYFCGYRKKFFPIIQRSDWYE